MPSDIEWMIDGNQMEPLEPCETECGDCPACQAYTHEMSRFDDVQEIQDYVRVLGRTFGFEE